MSHIAPRFLLRAAAGALAALVLGAAPEKPAAPIAPEIAAALRRISPARMRGDLSFLASDLLEGRDTPSRGLDIAAEFIAARFRAAGLESAGDDGYFQTAPFLLSAPRLDTFRLTFESNGTTSEIRKIEGGADTGKLDIERAVPASPSEKNIAGKVVLVRGSFTAERRRALVALHPALIVLLSSGEASSAPAARRLVEAGDRADAVPVILVRDKTLLEAASGDLADARISVHLDAPEETPVKLRNVIGVLRGSDPALRASYVLVTAHYDHIGVRPDCHAGDCIFNGANDDASGTVSVIELARAMAEVKPRPRRTIVFMTLFGEERGSLGARYYTRHPVFPLAATIADVNLEQLGRTDATEGPRASAATLTGWSFSDLPGIFHAAGLATGVKVNNTETSAQYFSRSDNRAFADAGIPAHTVAVAYQYPDYHDVGDSWDKIDYANMAKVDRMLALGILTLADSKDVPRWNVNEAKAAPYLKAWRAAQPAN